MQHAPHHGNNRRLLSCYNAKLSTLLRWSGEGILNISWDFGWGNKIRWVAGLCIKKEITYKTAKKETACCAS